MSGKLSLVATPIGNLKDITLRAIDKLKEVDIIACEDTRRTKILTGTYGIKKTLVPYHSYNYKRQSPWIISQALSGKNVAVVSDSGTPGISDPGEQLVRAAVENNIPVESIPGPTAFVSGLVCSGLPTNGFVFLGFLQRKKGKIKKMLTNCLPLKKTVIFYESVHRLTRTLSVCGEVFGETFACVIAREITKKFEEYIRGTIPEVIEKLNEKEKLKGEFVVLLHQ